VLVTSLSTRKGSAMKGFASPPEAEAPPQHVVEGPEGEALAPSCDGEGLIGHWKVFRRSVAGKLLSSQPLA
jgi:hypothetical protein